MKAIITEEGILRIVRPGETKMMECVNDKESLCTDDCPAFREPYDEPANGRGEKNYTGWIGLRLCQQVGTLYFDEIDDQRGK